MCIALQNDFTQTNHRLLCNAHGTVFLFSCDFKTNYSCFYSIVPLQRSIGNIEVDDIRENDEAHDWLNMLENNVLDVATLSEVKNLIISRCKLTTIDDMSQNDLIKQTHDFIEKSSSTVFGRKFRASIVSTIFNSVYNIDANLSTNTNGLLTAHTSAIELDNKMDNKMLHTIKATLKQMCKQGCLFHYVPLLHQFDVVPEDIQEHMEELTTEEKFERHYQTEMDDDIEQLIKSAIVSLHHPYEKSEPTKRHLADVISNCTRKQFKGGYRMPPEVQETSKESGVSKICVHYEGLSNELFKKHVENRQNFIKSKNQSTIKLGYTKPVKDFISQFGKGVTVETSGSSDLESSDKEQIKCFLREYGKYKSKLRVTPSTTIKDRQDNILPSRNEALEEWMTAKTMSILPFPFMTFFLPLNTLNNAVPMTIQGFNNRCLDMNIISTPKEGCHSFKETITGEKQGFFDSKLSVVFFKQVTAVSSYSLLHIHILFINITIC